MNTNLQITLEIKQKIETILEAGGYETEAEVIDDALNLLQKRNQLRMAIQEGLIPIRFQRSDLKSQFHSHTDLGVSQCGERCIYAVTDGKKGSGPEGADQR